MTPVQIETNVGETDAPEDQQVEVLLRADSFNQYTNARAREEKGAVGIQLPQHLRKRVKGDRFMLDVADLSRLLAAEAVELPQDAEAFEELDQRVADLEAERAKLEAERETRRAEIQQKAEGLGGEHLHSERAKAVSTSDLGKKD